MPSHRLLGLGDCLQQPAAEIPAAPAGAARTDVVLPLRLVQRDVLADEHADADAGEVEAVQELVDVGQVIQPYAACQLALQLCGTSGPRGRYRADE